MSILNYVEQDNFFFFFNRKLTFICLIDIKQIYKIYLEVLY